MACNKTLNLSLATGDSPMDSACYDSTDNLIIGVRGNRVFQCNATTGAVISQSDYQQLGLAAASICWDSGLNRCFAVCWNTPSFDTFNALGIRQITRIIPTTLITDLVLDVNTIFSNFAGVLMQAGPGVIKSDGAGQVYLMGNSSFNAVGTIFRFQANNPVGSHESHNVGGEYMSFALATIGGNQRAYWNAVGSQDVEWWDFGTSFHGSGPLDQTHNRLAIEYAPIQGNFYITEEFQFIDIYDNTGTFVAQLNTLRSAFNGVNIKRNSNDGLLYIAGGADNTVIVLDPAANTFVVKTGFDLPWDFVFTPTKKWAVQQGSTPLKEVV